MNLSRPQFFTQMHFGILFTVVYSVLCAISIFLVRGGYAQELSCILPVGAYFQSSCRQDLALVGLNFVLTGILVGIASVYLYFIRKNYHPIFSLALFLVFPIINILVLFVIFSILMILSGGA